METTTPFFIDPRYSQDIVPGIFFFLLCIENRFRSTESDESQTRRNSKENETKDDRERKPIENASKQNKKKNEFGGRRKWR